MYGTISLSPNRGGPVGSWMVEVSLSSDKTSETLQWAVVPGRCGSGDVPLKQANELPTLEVRTNGKAELSAAVTFPLMPSMAYHFDIYRGGGVQADNVIACSDLKHSDK
jgi:hypothetical protein